MSIEFDGRAEIDIEIAAADIRDGAGVGAARDFATRLNRTLAVLDDCRTSGKKSTRRSRSSRASG